MTVDIRVMKVLSTHYLTVGLQHFLILADKISTYLWTRKYLHITTANAVNMLKEIIKIHGHPKMVVTENGPSFQNKFFLQLWSLNIDHSYS